MYIKLKVLLLFALLSTSISVLAQIPSKSEILPPAKFSEKVARTDSAVIVDVRTPNEFANGHIEGALNINWHAESFDEQVALLDKSKPIFVYCQSGGRSGSAATRLKELGFAHIFDMRGGMGAWRAEKLPEISPNTMQNIGMSWEEYQAMLQSDKPVLIGFYATWCAPCMAMTPYLERIHKELEGEMSVIQIDFDRHRGVAAELGIASPPVLILYDRLERIWQHHGYIEEAQIREQISLAL